MLLAPSRSDLCESLLITILLGITLGEPDGKIPTMKAYNNIRALGDSIRDAVKRQQTSVS